MVSFSTSARRVCFFIVWLLVIVLVTSSFTFSLSAKKRSPPNSSLTGSIGRPPNSARRPIGYDRHPETPVQTPQTLLRNYLPNHGSASQIRHRNTDARLASLNHQSLCNLQWRKATSMLTRFGTGSSDPHYQICYVRMDRVQFQNSKSSARRYELGLEDKYTFCTLSREATHAVTP